MESKQHLWSQVSPAGVPGVARINTKIMKHTLSGLKLFFFITAPIAHVAQTINKGMLDLSQKLSMALTSCCSLISRFAAMKDDELAKYGVNTPIVKHFRDKSEPTSTLFTVLL